jgi:hypothetical chaperone protein
LNFCSSVRRCSEFTLSAILLKKSKVLRPNFSDRNGFTGTVEPRIALNLIEANLSCQLQAEVLAEILAPYVQMLRAGVQETLQIAGLEKTSVGRVIYVGGSSLMSMVSDTMKAYFPVAQHSFTEVFTAVTDGLTIAPARV